MGGTLVSVKPAKTARTKKAESERYLTPQEIADIMGGKLVSVKTARKRF
jgi:hypothetical protein